MEPFNHNNVGNLQCVHQTCNGASLIYGHVTTQEILSNPYETAALESRGICASFGEVLTECIVTYCCSNRSVFVAGIHWQAANLVKLVAPDVKVDQRRKVGP